MKVERMNDVVTAREVPARAGALVRLVLVLVCAAAVVAPNSAASAIEVRTEEGIRARWQQLQPSYSGSPYLVTPNCTSPYSAGALRQEFQQDGLNIVNYARYLAGLPDDVVLDPSYASSAQHGAVLLAAGQFAHWQPKPADMDEAFYQIAVSATSASNIGWGHDSLWRFNLYGLNDADPSNIDRVGHRRWLLNPQMAKTGMGYASDRSDTYAFDKSRTSKVAYDAIRWPSAGPFPIEMFGVSVPWSVTLNPDVYSWTPGSSGHTVVLRRLRDGKTWTFTSTDTDKGGEYFNFDTGGYGVSNCFVFRPDPSSVGAYLVGDVYEVTLSGGITRKADGAAAVIVYTTRFITQASTDSVPPITTCDATATYEGTAIIRLVAADQAGRVATTEWRLDGGAWTASTTVSTSEPGVHRLEFRSADAAGNVEDVKSVTFAVWSATTVSLMGPSAPPSYNGSARLTASLKAASGAAVSDKTIVFERWTGARWLSIGTAATNSSGAAVIYDGALTAKQTYRARFEEAETYHASTSRSACVSPKTYLTNPKASTYADRYRRFAAYGYLKPHHTASSYPVRIYRWRYVSGMWKTYGYITAKAYDYSTYTKYMQPISLPYPGRWRLRAYTPADAEHAATWSGGYDYVTVR